MKRCAVTFFNGEVHEFAVEEGWRPPELYESSRWLEIPGPDGDLALVRLGAEVRSISVYDVDVREPQEVA